jgi:hypothetical protein
LRPALTLKNRLNIMLDSTFAPISAPISTLPPTSNHAPGHLGKYFTKKELNAAWAIAFALVVTASAVLLPSSAHADEDKAPSMGRSTGSRGCGIAGTAPEAATLATSGDVPALILLAPPDQRGQTVSTRPTFAWFVRDLTPMPLEFRIYEQTNVGYTLLQEIKGDTFRSTPGIMTLPAPAGLLKLSPGKRYRWQVELVCDPARPSGNLFAQAEVDVVVPTPALKQRLLALKSADATEAQLNQAQIYAEANLWYDALAATLPSRQDQQAVHDFRRTLMARIAANPAEHQLLHQSTISPSTISPRVISPEPVSSGPISPIKPQISGRQ